MTVRQLRRLLAAAAAAILAAGGLALAASPAQAALACDVDFDVNEWGDGAGGFTASITIHNLGDPVDGWTLAFDLPGSASLVQGWGADWEESGSTFSATSLDWNGELGTGDQTGLGFNGSGYAGPPSSFTLNGVVCDGGSGGPGPGPDPTVLASPGSLSLADGDTGQITFSLSEAPGGSVPVTVVTTANVSASPTSFTLTDATFATGVPVQVTGLSPGTGSVTASASGYDDAVVPVTVTDDSVPPRADNPYEGADVYVDPVWGQRVQDQAASTGGALGAAMQEVATYPTFVWMDRIGAITDGIGLVGHLDNAVAQDAANGSTPTVFQVVVYNLPNRDCAADASNGELLISENGFEIYREDYVDVIAEILNRPEYAELRIVAVIEVDSLPNLVTNTDIPACQEAAGEGGYRDGIRYVLNSLAGIPNVYSYLDIAHSGWLGWDSNFGPAVDLYIQTLTSSNFFGPAPGLDSVAGFVTNSANYTPTVEPFLPDPDLTPGGGGNPIRSADFYEWNPYFDELTFAQALHDAFSSQGMDGFGVLIDTSRNGWGGPQRPTEVSSSTDVDTYVDESRVDRRPHRGGWCNQAGAGIGERPTASPAEGIDAYVWVKPPGESDGVADPDFEPDPNDPNKQHDAMCHPAGQNSYDPSKPTNALPGAPHAGRWFPEQFEMLVVNAHPSF